MDTLQISGKRYISTRKAAKDNGYHSDYIGQLIRSGKVKGQKVGRSWYVLEESFVSYRAAEDAKNGNKHGGAAAEEAKIEIPQRGIREEIVADEVESQAAIADAGKVIPAPEDARPIAVRTEAIPTASTKYDEKHTDIGKPIDAFKLLTYIQEGNVEDGGDGEPIRLSKNGSASAVVPNLQNAAVVGAVPHQDWAATAAVSGRDASTLSAKRGGRNGKQMSVADVRSAGAFVHSADAWKWHRAYRRRRIFVYLFIALLGAAAFLLGLSTAYQFPYGISRMAAKLLSLL